jgi:hypothetical protein
LASWQTPQKPSWFLLTRPNMGHYAESPRHAGNSTIVF